MNEEIESQPLQSDCSIVKTYVDTEYPIDIIGNDTKETVYVRVLIMTRDVSLNSVAIVFTSNNKIFVTHNIQNGKVSINEELDLYAITELKQEQKKIKTQLSNLNELIEKLSLITKAHTIIGICNYVVTDTEELYKLSAKDFEHCFNIATGRWYYYSQALESWILLPKNWQKLAKVVRYVSDLTNIDYEPDITIGCLENNNVYQVVDNKLITIADPICDIGDEYIVPNKGYIIYTYTDWKFINIGD